MSIAVDGEQVRLTRREFELLRYLVENRNRVVSRDRLLERVWGYDRVIETRSVDVHVGRQPWNQSLTFTNRTPRRVSMVMRFGPVRGSPST